MAFLSSNKRLVAWRENLRFLRGNFTLTIAWPLMALLLSAIGWTVLLGNLDQSRHQYEQTALSNAAAFARSYASRMSRTLEAVDEIMLHLRHEWQLSGGTLRLDQMKQQGMLQPSFLFNALILDGDARIVTASAPPRKKSALEERPYFVAQKFAAEDRMYIGNTVLGVIAQQDVVPFSRRIVDQDGNFDGAVVVSITAEHLVANYDEAMLGANGLLSLIGNDSSVRVSRIGNTIFPAGVQAMTAPPNLATEAGSLLFAGREWFSDQRDRYVGWQPVAGYPLIAMTGLDRQTVLAPYWASRNAAIQKAVWVTLALAIFTIITMTLSMRLAWRKYQMELTQATYRVATEGSREGFILARPIRNSERKVVDFQIIDASHRGAEMIGQRREDVVGKNVSSLFQRPYRDLVLKVLCHALDSGYYEEELHQPPDSPIIARWLHLKAAHSGGDLALTLRDISDSRAHVAELERRGNEDALTGLPNRHWVQSYLPLAIERAKAGELLLALLFIDLDGFKKINDSMGHPVGDELLRNAARRLKLAVRPHDHVVRLGGDEFVVILEQLEHRSDAAHVADRILHAFQEGFRLSKGVHSVGTSIGISLYPADGLDADTLLQNADIAMYSVKTGGKRNYHFFEPRFYDALRARLEREAELRSAIDSDQFVMYYQPRVDMASGATCSMEALVRWVHPSIGMIEPSDFIPLAEETGLIVELGKLIIDKVCAQLAEWAVHGKPLVPVSINVSPRQFSEGDIGQIVASALARHKVGPELVEIELTESSMMGEDRQVHQSLLAMQGLGIKILVDDFGTGYSSLSQLQTLDFDVLKVDQAFTARIEKSAQGKIFFKAIITMAHALGMRVVAEGVENSDQVAILKSLDCDEIQGFYISRPMPADTLQAAATFYQ